MIGHKEPISMSTLNSSFLHYWNFYKQKDGLATETTVGPRFTNTFLNKLEIYSLHNIASLNSHARYIDDTIVTFDSADMDKILFFRTGNSCEWGKQSFLVMCSGSRVHKFRALPLNHFRRIY